MAAGPKFGSAGRSVRYSVDQSADRLDLINGFNIDLFFRKKNDSRSETKEKLLCYGIAGKEDTTRNPFGVVLSTVTHSENEDVITHESWEETRNPDTEESVQGGALVAVDALLKIRSEERWTVAGYCPPGQSVPNKEATEVPWKVGDTVDVPLVIHSATNVVDAEETLSIEIPIGAYLENVRYEGENTGFSTFSLEFVKHTPQEATTPFNDIILGVTGDFSNDELDFDPLDYFYKTSRTTTLNAEGWGTVETSYELHEKHSTGAVTPPTPAP